MNKFCTACGQSLNDSAKFCNHCGATQEAPPAPAFLPDPQFTPTPAAKKAVRPLWYFIGGGALAVIALIVILVLTLGGSGGPESAADRLVEIYQSKTGDISGLFPQAYWEYQAERSDLTVQDLIERYSVSANDVQHELAEDYGADYQIRYQLLDQEPVDSKELNAIAAALASYNINVKEVNQAQKLIGWMQIKGSLDMDHRTLELYAVEIAGDWYLIQCYTTGGTVYVSFFTGD